jgi:5'-3' exonuclease|tara:strand:+ start:1542 stop:2399 length:858 start_codon:yes stop_codon:yes gene_type:complete
MEYNNVILIDTSYTSFYRFFATKTWYSMAYKEEFKEIKDLKNYDWLKNKIFIEKYEKMYLDSIKKLVSAKVFKDSLIIFARDPPQASIWRNDEKCDYKDGRQDLTEKHNFKPVFKFTYNELIPRWTQENKNYLMIKQDKIEADDIIALACRYIQENMNKKSIYVVSGDEDFLQLGDDNVYFAQYKKKKVFKLTKQEAAQALLKKIILGDCSDNIPSIFKGKRVKNKKELLKELLEDSTKLKEYLEENKEIKDKFLSNQKIIDFTNIPNKYVKIFNSEFKKNLKSV